MREDKRILAVEMEEEIFLKVKDHVQKNNLTMKGFIGEIVKDKILSIEAMQETLQKTWTKEEVEKAIEDFIIRNGRVPKQTEFRNENRLPSYNAAGRSLDSSPAQYAQDKLRELFGDSTGIEGADQGAGNMQTIVM